MILVQCRMRLRWWVRYYLRGVLMVAQATGREPDWKKVGRVIARGVKVEIVKGRP